jgi:predicted component of type VI protein secretion system
VYLGVVVSIGVRVEDPKTQFGFERTFQRLPVRIGRSPLNDLHLDFPSVSGFHAVLEEHDGKVMLRDLGSKNGTRVKSGLLPPNQLVDLAEHRNQFAILPVLLTTFPVETELAKEPIGPKNVLKSATTMFELSPLASSHAPTPPPSIDFQRILNGLAESVAASRDANHNLMKQIEAAVTSAAPDMRSALAEQIGKRFPDVAQRPEGRALLAQFAPSLVLPAHSPELVVEAVKEIAEQQMPSLGAPQRPEELGTYLTQVNEALRVFLECFLQLREGWRQTEAEFGVGKRGFPKDDLSAVTNMESLAKFLFNWRKRDFSAAQELERAFADMMINQVALIGGVKNGAKSVVEELSPAAIEREANDPKRGGTWWPFGRYQKLWEIYCARHADMAEEQRLFRVLFGRAFGEMFNEFRDRPSSLPDKGQD